MSYNEVNHGKTNIKSASLDGSNYLTIVKTKCMWISVGHTWFATLSILITQLASTSWSNMDHLYHTVPRFPFCTTDLPIWQLFMADQPPWDGSDGSLTVPPATLGWNEWLVNTTRIVNYRWWYRFYNRWLFPSTPRSCLMAAQGKHSTVFTWARALGMPINHVLITINNRW